MFFDELGVVDVLGDRRGHCHLAGRSTRSVEAKLGRR